MRYIERMVRAGLRATFPRGLACCFLAILAGMPGWAQGSAPQEPAKSQAPGAVAMIVGQRKITVSELCAAIAELPPPQAKAYPLHPPLAAQWWGPLVALAEEGKREGLAGPAPADENPVGEENGLAAALIQKIARDLQPTESQIEEYYAAHQSELERTRASHILISDAAALASRSPRSPAEAKLKAEAVAAELKRGADFSMLAGKDSDDPYTRTKGGDLGEVARHQMEPAVDKVLWSLGPGQTSAPFQGRFGYEIVKVQTRRILPLKEVRQTIVGDLKFLGAERKQEQIISAAHITLKPVFRNSPLPCDSGQATLRPSARTQ